MKSLLLLLALFPTLALADLPPPSGSKVTAEITDSAAKILADSMSEPVTASPNYIEPITTENGEINQAKVRFVETRTSKVTIACFTYYYRGHHATCKMVEVYK